MQGIDIKYIQRNGAVRPYLGIMIYKNFLYFIIAVAIFVTAPVTPNDLFPVFQDILIIPILIFLFSLHIRNSFIRLQKRHRENDMYPGVFRSEYLKITNYSLIKAIVLFIFEIYIFDLKVIILSTFRLGGITFAGDVLVLSIFIFHFAIVWYWGYKIAGEIVYLSQSVWKFISDNIKFNLAIVIPWLILTLGTDILKLLNITWITENSGSPLFQVTFFGLFLLIFLIIGPIIIIKLWDCKPLSEGDLRNKIVQFTEKEGISFKQILSWNSLSKSLMTAGVLGYFPFSRYLLITPELMNFLSDEEIIAVVSHETGHVKRKHILYYLLLFIGFAIISGGLMNIINLIILSSPVGIDLLSGQADILGVSPFHFLAGTISILMFILYFRFIFGYFMRNFEREADVYCFDSGVDPDHLVSSFEKLGGGIKEKKGSNWHHFSIGERIDFIEKCIKDRSEIIRHRKKVKKSVLGYVTILITLLVLTMNPLSRTFNEGMERKVVLGVLERGMERSPSDYRLYSAAAAIYHEMEKWDEAKNYYEKSLAIKYDQPETLNNLAWLLVTCEDELFRERRRGLRLARDAASLKTEAHIYDTLAEAFLINEKYEEAVEASETALKLSGGDTKYFEDQLMKMRKYLGISGSTFKL